MKKAAKFTLSTVAFLMLFGSSESSMERLRYEPKVSSSVKTVILKPKTEYIVSEPKIRVKLTAYSNDVACTGRGDGITKSGVQANSKTIAAPSSIEMGSLIYIGDTMKVVQDRGSAIIVKDGVYVFDVWQPSYEKAVQFGVKWGYMVKVNGVYKITLDGGEQLG